MSDNKELAESFESKPEIPTDENLVYASGMNPDNPTLKVVKIFPPAKKFRFFLINKKSIRRVDDDGAREIKATVAAQNYREITKEVALRMIDAGDATPQE